MSKATKKPQETELYRKTENVQELLENLRDSYIGYKESAGRCKIELRPRPRPTKAEAGTVTIKDDNQFKNFYVPPRIPQLDEPEKQKKFRKEYIAEVGARPAPEPVTLLADNLHLEVLEQIADKSKPSVLRQELADFFKRRAVSLQHKKYKMLSRWGNQVLSSEQSDLVSYNFDQALGRLLKETDSSLNRSERLSVDDSYDDAVDTSISRPQPTSNEQEGGQEGTLLYVEAPVKCINSVIRHDDIEVFLRIQTYRNKLFRVPNKLAASIKWLAYSSRFEIWQRSRELMHASKIHYNEHRDRVLRPVAAHVKSRLIGAGVADEKLLQLVTHKYTQHLEIGFVNHYEEALNSHLSDHQKPPFLCTSNVELKLALIPLAQEANLTIGDTLDTDEGHQFAYAVHGAFPAKFQSQVLAMQFDWADSGEGTQADTDVLLIQKLTTELNLDKNEMLAQMAKQAEIERNKSILGKIGKDSHSSEQVRSNGGSSKDQKEDVARQNLIRRIKEMKFFSLDETHYKLKKANWLRYVCWEPEITEAIKRQNHMISSHDENPIDSLLLSAFEFIDVNEAGAANKILEDSSTAHVKKVKGYFTEVSHKVSRFDQPADENSTVETMLKGAALGDTQRVAKEAHARDDSSHYNQGKVEEFLQNIDPLKQHMIKSYYTLRLLKSRDIKAKMIQALNYFRGVQKRLAFDVREFFTRERALGGQKTEEALIGPQFGKDEYGNLNAKKGDSTGPGGINANRLSRDMDNGAAYFFNADGEQKADPVSIKGYKYNRQFNPYLSSTCPCVPRFHTTFGRPTLYEEVSQEFEKGELHSGKFRQDRKSNIAFKDRLIFKAARNLSESEIAVIDEHGARIVYQEALNDMLLLEEEMIKIGSHYLNKAELEMYANTQDQPLTMLDRGEIALNLFEKEFELQVIKIEFIELLLEVYEHTCDPLESVRLLQMVTDTMALRPRMNLEATYFSDSYTSEIEVLKQKIELFSELLSLLKRTELESNEEIRKFQELKLRKLQEFISGKWSYGHNPRKIERVGAKEESSRGTGIEDSKQGQRAKHLKEMQRQLALKEIAERHITEFAGNQHTDFANVLGLPEVTAKDLFKKQGQQDPLVIDAVREHANFSKQTEGYPWLFQKTEEHSSSLGYHTTGVGVTDFLESLCAITRINAACAQSYTELAVTHRPENGMASSCLERALLIEARGCLRVLRRSFEEGTTSHTKCANRIEEDFYLSSSDKLVYLMREFKSEMNPDRIEKVANPLLVSKLDVNEVAKFDFPRIKHQEVEGYEELNDEQLLEKMIDMAKITVTRKLHEEERLADIEGVQDSQQEKLNQIESPSLLVLACNTIEVIRLRELLVRVVHEADVLGTIFMNQLAATNKQARKLFSQDPIPFDTQAIIKENMNLVDYNDGTKLNLDLPSVMEFDATLKACLDFKSESCVKGLMTKLGVEELRAVVHYQIMQKQILEVAVTRNQFFMDGPQQGLVEVKLLERRPYPISVPGAVVDMREVLSRAVDGPHSENCKKESQRLSSNLTKEVGERIYQISHHKTKHRPLVSKKYSQLHQRVSGRVMTPETKLRILRSYRIRLLHEFCQDVMKDVYFDSIPTQTLLACRELRRKVNLFPPDASIFHLGQSTLQEHIPKATLLAPETNKKEPEERYTLDQLIRGKLQTFFYIPASNEILEASRPTENGPGALLGAPVDIDKVEEVDKLLQVMTKPPKMCSPTEVIAASQGQLTLFKEAHNHSSVAQHLLHFFTSLVQIVSLEYYMGRNHTPGAQILALEAAAHSGQQFWNVFKFQKQPEASSLKNAPDRVISKIMNQKRARVDLAEDMAQICKKISKLNEFLQHSNADQLKLPNLLALLRLMHQSSFLRFMNGMENSLDIYLDHKSDENLAKIFNAMNALCRRDHGLNMLNNGFYLNQGSRKALMLDPTSPILEDQYEFTLCYQPAIDEHALAPPQISLVRKLYGRNSHRGEFVGSGRLGSAMPDYHMMKNSFFNMDDEQRSFIATNFYHLDEGVNDYLILKNIIPNPNAPASSSTADGKVQIHITRPREVLDGTVEYLALKVEARHLQRVLMSWATCAGLPMDTEGYEDAQKLYREQTLLKVLLERDVLVERYYESKERSRDGAESLGSLTTNSKKLKKERATIMESVNPYSKEHSVVSKVFQTKAEIVVARRVLDVEMIKISMNMIKQEHASLLATFEQGASSKSVHAYVHPQQQFASTLYQSVDENSHLDVVNKLGFVQSFLTKLRNRCTEVETLASGPGIVFSMKDFNECLQVFCQGLLKYCETELRSRVETQHIRQNQYQHLLYMKEKQALYYRRKCEQFLDDIDKLVNAKISQKGSQLIYELDVASRELRVLKDNYRLMRTMMMEELRHEYLKAIQEKQNKISQLREQYSEHRERVTTETILEVSTKFKELEEKVEKRKRDADIDNGSTINVRAQPRNGMNRLADIPELPEPVRQGIDKQVDTDTMKEVLGLHAYIRKHKVLTMMKSVLAQERHEKEIANQRAQLTSNAALWDQLAEAEKREQITKQELSLTKMSLASYEKLIEKLQGQLENLNNQKQRLQQYKNSKSKRIDELEQKMKDLEILENIDLNRILNELKSRDKKIGSLETENYAQKNELNYLVNHKTYRTVNEMKKRISYERELKLQAYDRLEGLRVEMRALEGKDMKSDLWKDKCRELFDICKDLERENDDLKSLVKDANQAHLLQAQQEARAYARSDVLHRGGIPQAAGQTGSQWSGKALTDWPPTDLPQTINPSGPSFPSVMLGGQDFDAGSLAKQSLRKTGPLGGDNSNARAQHETIHSENFQSNYMSGAVKQGSRFPEDMLSLQSGGQNGSNLNGNPTITSGFMGPRQGLLSGPLAGSQPPRTIMTAGGGHRVRNDAFGQNKIPIARNGKRLQTSQQPRGGPRMGNRNIVKSGNSSNPGGSIPYQSINPTNMGLGGVTMKPNPEGIYSAGRSVQGLGVKQGSQKTMGGQPVNFNINFNTTNINMK